MITADKLFSKTNVDGLVWALWHWNGQVCSETLKQQFDNFVKDGFNGIVIKATTNASCGFMSDEFLEYFKLVLGWAKKEKILVMYADELNRQPESHFYSLVANTKSYRSERLYLLEKTFCNAGEKYSFAPEMFEKAYIVAFPAANPKFSPADAVVIYDDKNAGKPIVWTAPTATNGWQILKFGIEYEKNRDGRFIPNMYNTELAQIYSSTVLAKILETVRSVDKAVFKGFVFEMPAIIPSSHGICWDSEILPAKYHGRYKKNLVSLLPALFVPTDDNFVKIRPQIYNFLWDNAFGFPATVAKWVKDEGVDFWFVGQESDIRNPKFCGTNTVTPNFGQTASATAFRTDNHASQAAFIMQCEVSRTEGIPTVGIVGRDSTMKSYSIGELKSLIDWQVLFGADKILIDGFYLSTTYRYEDFSPPAISFNHPDYQYMKDLVSQTKRMLSLNFGRKAPEYGVAVIAPSQSRLADLQLVSENTVIDESVKIFLQVIGDLRTYQIPYTIITEENFAKGENVEITNDGFIKTKNGVYSAAILTYMRLINNPFFTQLEKMSLKKGIILFADKKPAGSFDDNQSEAFLSRVDRMFSSRSRECKEGSVSEIVDLLSKSFENIIGHIHIEKGNCGVLIDNRAVGEDLVTTVLNTSNENIPVEIARTQGKYFLKIDVESGQILNIDSDTNKNAPLCFVIHPREIIFLLETAANPKQLEGLPIKKIDAIVPEYRSYINKESGIFETKSLNRFPLSRWKAMVSKNPERNTINYNYETIFEAADLPEIAILVFYDKIPSSSIEKRFKVKLNGIEIPKMNKGDYPQQYCEDKKLLAFDISQFIIKDKQNMVSVQKCGDGDLPDPIAYPPFILLSAAVEKGQSNVWKILDSIAARTCSWDTKGYSYLIGRASSVYRFEVPKNYQQVVLAFDDLSGASQITLNDKKHSDEEGALPNTRKHPLFANMVFPPYRIDITNYVIDKRNDLLITSSSNMNPQNRLSPSIGGVLGNAYLEIIMKE